jgi:hypothetical protein
MIGTRAYQDADPTDYDYMLARFTLEVFATFYITIIITQVVSGHTSNTFTPDFSIAFSWLVYTSRTLSEITFQRYHNKIDSW